MLWAAFRPRVTTGLIPVLAGFVVVLFAYSTDDLMTGAAPVSRVAGHGLLVVSLGFRTCDRQAATARPDPASGRARRHAGRARADTTNATPGPACSPCACG